ncbi:pilus assembly protein TadG-related protein [Planctomycetota bacterium]
MRNIRQKLCNAMNHQGIANARNPEPLKQTSHLVSNKRRRRGIVLVWVAIFGLAIIGLMGLGIDQAKVFFVAHQLQNGVDAAALAGAIKLKTGEARQNAVGIAAANSAEILSIKVLENTANDPAGDVVLGQWLSISREFVPTTLSPNAVKVFAHRQKSLADAQRPAVTLHFGPAFNVETADVERVAIARNLGNVGAGIITLAEHPENFSSWNHGTGLVMNGSSGTIDLRGFDAVTREPLVGDVQINAVTRDSNKAALVINGGPEIMAGNFNVVGDTKPSVDNVGKWESMYSDVMPFAINAYPKENVPVLPDPLLGVVPPDTGKMTKPHANNVIDDSFVSDESGGTGSLSLAPGYYPGGISVKNVEVILTGGVYALGGSGKKSGLHIGNNAVVRDTGTKNTFPAIGVMVYITDGGSIDNNGQLLLRSRGDVLFQAISNPSPEDMARLLDGELGVVLWQDRANENQADFGNNSVADLTGTVYLGYNPIKVHGNPDSLGTQLIAGALELDGGVNIQIGYDGRNRSDLASVALVK